MALTYNGYKNYETWFIKFHFFNEEELWFDYTGVDLYHHVKDELLNNEDYYDTRLNSIINHFLTYVHFEQIYETIKDHKEELNEKIK